jgi:hypothetical protein
VGTVSPPKTAALTNVGTTALTITSISIAGAQLRGLLPEQQLRHQRRSGQELYDNPPIHTDGDGPADDRPVSIADGGGGSPQKLALTGTGTYI